MSATVNASESICYGTSSNGRLESGVKLPSEGSNFVSYSTTAAVLGRTYVHSKVKEIMSQPLIHVHPNESILDVAEIMTSKNIHKLPIIVNDEILGIISSSDLVVIFTMISNEDLVKIFKPYLQK